jgi:hypothetical protein
MVNDDGTVYTVHFDERIGGPGRNGAQHYTGHAITGRLLARLTRHRNGTSQVPIMDYLHRHGIGWTVVDLQPGTYADEIRLKNHGAAYRCFLCKEAT